MGRHSKPPRIRLPQATAGAAGTTVAGVAAAICLSPQAPAAASVMPSASAHHATVPPAYQRGPTPAQLLAVGKHATAHKAGSDDRTWYTVRRGDTLSSISARYLDTSRRWQGLWSANRKVIGGNPDKVRVGETLRLANDGLTAGEWHHLRHLARVASQYQARHARQATTTTEQPTQSAPATSSAPSASTSTWSGAYPGGSFGACVVARESGGNSQVMNSTGHYGLYQFSASTWAAYGGNPADFGHASVAEQNQVFANALAQGGQSNWSPYDGC